MAIQCRAHQRSASSLRIRLAPMASVSIAALFLLSLPVGTARLPTATSTLLSPASPMGSIEPSTGSGAAWPMYMADVEHTSYQATGDGLNVTSVRHLQQLWNFTTGGDVVSEPAVVNNSVYFGSWDGYEYSVYANN